MDASIYMNATALVRKAGKGDQRAKDKLWLQNVPLSLAMSGASLNHFVVTIETEPSNKALNNGLSSWTETIDFPKGVPRVQSDRPKNSSLQSVLKREPSLKQQGSDYALELAFTDNSELVSKPLDPEKKTRGGGDAPFAYKISVFCGSTLLAFSQSIVVKQKRSEYEQFKSKFTRNESGLLIDPELETRKQQQRQEGKKPRQQRKRKRSSQDDYEPEEIVESKKKKLRSSEDSYSPASSPESFPPSPLPSPVRNDNTLVMPFKTQADFLMNTLYSASVLPVTPVVLPVQVPTPHNMLFSQSYVPSFSVPFAYTVNTTIDQYSAPLTPASPSVIDPDLYFSEPPEQSSQNGFPRSPASSAMEDDDSFNFCDEEAAPFVVEEYPSYQSNGDDEFNINFF